MEYSSKKNQELQLVIFILAEEEFGVDIGRVTEIIKYSTITPIPKASAFIEGVIDLRGRILPVIDLAKRLNLASRARSDKSRIIVVEADNSSVGMIVDEVTEVLRLAQGQSEGIPHILGSLAQHSCIKGIGKFENERLVILIDLAEILSSEEIETIKKVIRTH